MVHRHTSAARKRRVWPWIFAGVCFALIGVFFVARFCSRIQEDLASAGAQLDAERELARREGIPLEPSDLFPDRPIDDSSNAAPILAEACAIINRAYEDADAGKAIEGLFATASETDVRVVAKLIEDVGPQLEAVIQAAKLPHCDFGKDYSVGTRITYPEFVGMRIAAKVLTSHAVLLSRAKRFDSAERNLKAAMRLAEFMAREPSAIAQMASTSPTAIVQSGLRKILKENSSDARAYEMAERILSQQSLPDVRRALEGEVVILVATIRGLGTIGDVKAMAEEYGAAEPIESGGLSNVFFNAIKRGWETRVIQYYREILNGLQNYSADDRGLISFVEQVYGRYRQSNDPSYWFAAQGGLAAVSAVRSRIVLQARTEMCKGYCLLLAYRREHGEFPQDLGALGVELVDPIVGKPLRYRRTKEGFLIYSVAWDLQDDGGIRRSESADDEQRQYDYVVQYP